jgi:hypothetical protein
MPLWLTVCLIVSAVVAATGLAVYLINTLNHE